MASLYWVTGIATEQIASTLVEALPLEVRDQGTDSLPGNRRVLIRPDESQLGELLEQRFGFGVNIMEEYSEDSFLIVNKDVVLDLTPLMPDEGKPEYIEDPVVANVYIDFFVELEDRLGSTQRRVDRPLDGP